MKTTKTAQWAMALGLAVALGGCGTKKCRDGTLFLDVEFQGTTDTATQLGIVVAYGTQIKQTTIAHTAGKSGGLEVDFANGYPSGMTGTVTVTALGPGGTTLGTGRSPVAFTDKCVAATVTVTSGSMDLSTQDLSGSDLAGVDMTPAMTAVLSLDNQPTYDFGNVTVGSSPAPVTLTVSNTGGAASSAIAPATLGGTAASSFAIVSDNCQTQVLLPGTSCTILVQLLTTAVANPTATLNVSATSGGTATVQLTGNVVAAGAITLTAVPSVGPTVSLPSGTANITITATNGGGSTTGGISFSIAGTAKAEYSITGGTCVANQTLATTASCTIIVQFAPTASGTRNATLTVNATPGGPGVIALAGVATSPASLAFTASSYSAGATLNASSTTLITTTLKNSGTQASAALPATIQTNNHTDFVYNSGGTCTPGAPLAGGASCTILVQFQPTTYGAKSDTLALTVGGSPVSTGVTGTAQQTFTLTVTNSGATGTDETTSTPSGEIACGNGASTCTASYTVSTSVPSVTLNVTTGSSSRFLNFGGDCSGSTCTLNMSTNRAVTANWQATFVATVTFAGTGTGTIASTSSPSQLSQFACSGTCSVTFDTNMTVTVTGSPGSGGTLAWSGGSGCSGSGACTITSAHPTATATFGANPCTVGPSAPHYVDPANGSDSPGNGGATGSCAYMTITYALAHSTGAIYTAAGTYSTSETFPLTLSGVQSLYCQGASISASQSGLYPNVIVMNGNGNVVSNCAITQTGGMGGSVIAMSGTSGTVSGCSIAPDGAIDGAACIRVNSGAATLSGNTCYSTYQGIAWISGTTGDVSNNSFSGSFSYAPIDCGGANAGVTGSGDTLNGAALSGSTCFTCANCPF